MWNVKRVLIYLSSLFASFVCFAVYALFLGHINAMAILPFDMRPTVGPPPDESVGVSTVDQKLMQAFGSNCGEKQLPLRLWLADKGIAFAAGDFTIEKDGKVKMAPLSVALFHKNKTPGPFPEISTIKCDVAYLTLDKVVTSYSELNNRDIVAVEMSGKHPDIVITNNRRSAETSDDVDIRITNGNLIYEKQKNLIWTDGVVRLLDYQSKPPTEVRGRGLKMHLAQEAKSKAPPPTVKLKASKPAHDNGNVERIHLLADVDMHFWVDAKAGFLGGEPNEKNAKPAAAPGPPEKAHIHIKTGGPFVYDLVKETASFESPAVRDPGAGPIAPDQVHVERRLKSAGSKFDQLICDRLDLTFRKRTNANEAGAVGGSDKEIESAHATRRDKNDLVVSLDTEKMAAYGAELFYRAGDFKRGPETILKGEPLQTVKDGHKMVCRELYLFAADRLGEGQKAVAKGKGQIDVIDLKGPKPTFPTHVLWDDTLTIVKEKEGDKIFDVITVTGNASFIDDQQKQELHGNEIKVWIEQLSESNRKGEAANNSRQELRRVLAIDQVRAASPEFIIRKTNRLNMVFVPQPPQAMRLPDVAEQAGPMVIQTDPSVTPAPAPAKDTKVAEKKTAAPIELSGIEITGTVFTLAGKKELQDLVVKGNVHVFQPGEKAGEKKVDITGQLLTVKYADKGHVMVVHGDAKNLAHVEMGELTLWGPIVTVDKGENRADVAGRGAMRVPSNKNLDGTDAPKGNGGMLIIHWNKDMKFDGRMAIFDGGVQAYQNEYSKLQCENLTTVFDKFVSFADGQKASGAKIDKIICDRNLFIDDSKVDERKQLVQRNVLMGTEMKVDNLEGGTFIGGPGEVRTLGKGNASLNAAPEPNAPPSKQEWKLTHVKFTDRMFSNTKAATKNAIFRGFNSGVEVFHFATTDINAKMNADKPGKDQLYLRCGELHVEGKQFAERTTQYMVAKQNVEFRTDKYLGYADVVKYDESTEIVIFEGLNGNRVRMYDVSGDRPRETMFSTSKVLYNRRTGVLESADVKSISN